MRLKYQSLIALGIISSLVFSGCTSNGGGFLNLGVADALRKSNVCIFKKRLQYSKTPLGNTGLSLPTFGTQPTAASGPVVIDSYTTQQNAAAITQAAPATSTGGCGCGCGEAAAVGTEHEQFYMPRQQYVVEQEVSNQVVAQPPTEIVAPPVETVTSPVETTPNSLPEVNALPESNPLPGAGEVETNKGNNFDKFDTEGTLEPLGNNETDDVFEIDSQEEFAEGQQEKDQSIFEEAELTKRSQIKFDRSTSSSRTGQVAVAAEPKMLTLHARPAQSHHVFNPAVNKQKALETVQASHKPYYRQLNALRQQPTKWNDPSYRQARNTTADIEFQPLPPVAPAQPVEVLTPNTKMVPLKDSDLNQGTPNEGTEKSNTRTADANGNQTVKTTPRVPLLRATTVSSASILSLKNLANVIDDSNGQRKFYDADRRTAQGVTSSSDGLNSGAATVER